jgi:hypothetical protein
MSEQKSVLARPLDLKESFQWAPDEYIRLLRQTEAGSVYRVRAIHVAKSFNRFAYTEEELRAAGRTLGYRPLNLNHETPLPFPANRVIDSEYEDECVEALIVVADPCLIQLIEAKKIVAVSIEGQYRWADVVCDEWECAWNPHGIVLTALALLTPGVEPGDPLASIVLKKRMEAERSRTALVKKLEPASPVITGMTSLEVDTKPNQGGVLMEKKQEAAPPLEPAKTEQAQAVTLPAPVLHEEPPKPAAEKEPCQELIGKANDEIAKLRDQVSTLESQVRLLQERRKGSRGN